MPDAQLKRSAPELAVQAIESAILRTFPGYSENTFHIETRKIVTADGVRHEIDIWVKVELGTGYDAAFIFECRNWQEKISKNDIIVFSEKIRVTSAQKGYFVARSFTKDAVAQAKKDQRIILLKVNDLPSNGIPIPFGFHGINLEGIAGDVRMTLRRKAGTEAQPVPINPSTSQLIIDGQKVDGSQYINEWMTAEADARSQRFPSTTADEGVHELEFDAIREFAGGRATLDGDDLLSISVNGKVKVRVVK